MAVGSIELNFLQSTESAQEQTLRMYVSKMRTKPPAKFSLMLWRQTAAVISILAENEKDVTILYFAPRVCSSEWHLYGDLETVFLFLNLPHFQQHLITHNPQDNIYQVFNHTCQDEDSECAVLMDDRYKPIHCFMAATDKPNPTRTGIQRLKL